MKVVFTEILENALSMSIDIIKFEGIEPDVFWLDEFTVRLFGGRADILLNEMQKLYAAHNHEDLFLPTDYHFLLLDRVLNWYCIIYNDTDDESLLIYKGDVVVPKLDIDSIRNTFFFDSDYEQLDPLILYGASSHMSDVFDKMGMSPSGKNIQKGKLVDCADLKLEKWTQDMDWEVVDDDLWFEKLKLL